MRGSSLLPLFLGRVFGVEGPLESVFFCLDGGMGESNNISSLGGEDILVDRCFICQCRGEGVDHPLIHCTVASHLWCFVFRSFGISLVMPGSVRDLLFGWRNWLGKYLSKNICRIFGIWFHFV